MTEVTTQPTTQPKPLYLRYYSSDPDVPNKVSRKTRYVPEGKTVAQMAAEVSNEHSNDPYFRWYEPLDRQLDGRHW